MSFALGGKHKYQVIRERSLIKMKTVSIRKSLICWTKLGLLRVEVFVVNLSLAFSPVHIAWEVRTP